jgi:GNAT superfamily N-acetyltransferase
MLDLKYIKYNKKALLYENLAQQVFIEKTFFEQLGVDQYFIKMFIKSNRGNLINLGYLYFCLDFEENISYFIGMYIQPKFRNNGLSTLLISIWLQLCLENGFCNFQTIINQRKPFIVYSLKRYGFDLKDLNQYESSKHRIYICENSINPEDANKYLLFENDEQRGEFITSTIAEADNYRVFETLPLGFTVLDTILLKQLYTLQDENKAYNLSLRKLRSNYSDINTYSDI